MKTEFNNQNNPSGFYTADEKQIATGYQKDQLQLSNAELDRVSATTLQLGDNTTGDVVVEDGSGMVAPDHATDLRMISGADIRVRDDIDVSGSGPGRNGLNGSFELHPVTSGRKTIINDGVTVTAGADSSLISDGLDLRGTVDVGTNTLTVRPHTNGQEVRLDSNWFDTNWDFRTKVTVDADKVDGNLSDFPVYVDLSELPYDFFQNVQSDGSDIRVTDEDGTTLLDRELVQLDTGKGTGELHFRANQLSSEADETFYIYYGNGNATGPATTATDVWNFQTKLVQHLNEADTDGAADGNTDYLDSTRFDHDGSDFVSATGQRGWIDGGQQFAPDATHSSPPDGDFISMGDDGLDGTFVGGNSTFTVSGWLNPEQLRSETTNHNSQNVWLARASQAANDNIEIGVSESGNLHLYLDVGGAEYTKRFGSGELAGSGWHHASVTFDAGDVRVNLDGTTYTDSAPVATLDGGVAGSPTTIGVSRNVGAPFSGNLDEIRVHNTARDASWATAEFRNQDNPDTFFTRSTLELNNRELSRITAGTLKVGDQNTGTVTAAGSSTIDAPGVNNLSVETGAPRSNIRLNTGIAMSGGVRLHANRDEGGIRIVEGATVIADNDGTGTEDSALIADDIVLNGEFNAGENKLTIRPDNGTDTDDVRIMDNTQDALWFDQAWTDRVKVTVDGGQVAGTVEDFPVYVDLSELSSTNFFSEVSGKDDIRVTQADGTTQVPREVVKLGSGSGELHFRADQLSSGTDKTFYIYYGNSGAGKPDPAYQGEQVWTNGQKGVWHLDEGSGNAIDSTTNGNDGIVNGATQGVSGQIDDAYDFDGTNDNVDTDISENLQTGSFTLSTWFKPDTEPSSGRRLFADDGGSGWAFSYGDPGSGRLRFFLRGMDDVTLDTGSVINQDQWHHVVAVFDNADNNRYIYVDSGIEASRTNDTGTPASSPTTIRIAATQDNNRNFDGTIDETRIYNRAQSADEISTQFNNQGVGAINGPGTSFFKTKSPQANTPDRLELSSAELNNVTAETLQVGDQHVGSMTLEDNVNLDTVSQLEETRLGAGGSISQTAGSYTFAGRTRVDAENSNVTLNQSTNDFGTLGFDDWNATGTPAAANTVVVDENAINLGASDVSGTFDLTAGGMVTDSGALTIDDTTTVDATNHDVVLDTPGNDFSTFRFQDLDGSGDRPVFDATVVDTDDIDLGASDVNNSFDLTAGDTVTDIGSVVVGDTMTIDATGANVTLDDTNNDFGTIQFVDLDASGDTPAGDVVVEDRDDIDLGTSDVAGTFDLTAVGDVTNDSGRVIVGGLTTFDANGNNITANNPDNDFSTVEVLLANNVTLSDTNAIAFAEIEPGSITNDLSVTAGGLVDLTNPMNIGNNAAFDAGRIHVFDAFVAGNNLTVNAGRLDQTGTVTAGNDITVDTSLAEVAADLTAGNRVSIDSDLRTADGVTVNASRLTFGGGVLEVGDLASDNSIGTLDVNADLFINGDATVEMTLGSSDSIVVDDGNAETGGDVTLRNEPTLELTSDKVYDDGEAFLLFDHRDADPVSGTFDNEIAAANAQVFEILINNGTAPGTGNDVVVERTSTEFIQPPEDSTSRGGEESVPSTEAFNVPGEGPVEPVDALSAEQLEAMAGDVGQATGINLSASAEEETPSVEETAKNIRAYLENEIRRNRGNADVLEQGLSSIKDERQADQTRTYIDDLREQADRQEQTLKKLEEGQDVGILRGDGENQPMGDRMRHFAGLHDIAPDQGVKEISASQLRDQLQTDLQVGVFSQNVPVPVLAAIRAGLEGEPVSEEPDIVELRDVARLGERQARARGDSDIAARMADIRHDAGWWINSRVLRFRTSVSGEQAPWGMSVVEVRMSRDTGEYLMHVETWIDEGASEELDAGAAWLGRFGGDVLSEYEGYWYSLTLTGHVEQR